VHAIGFSPHTAFNVTLGSLMVGQGGLMPSQCPGFLAMTLVTLLDMVVQITRRKMNEVYYHSIVGWYGDSVMWRKQIAFTNSIFGCYSD